MATSRHQVRVLQRRRLTTTHQWRHHHHHPLHLPATNGADPADVPVPSTGAAKSSDQGADLAAADSGLTGPSKRRTTEALKADVLTPYHQMVHKPKNPYCVACQVAKRRRTSGRRKTRDGVARPPVFGDQITCDHIVADRPHNIGVTGDRDALVVLDRATRWVGFYPSKTKASHEVEMALKAFIGPTAEAKYAYSDNAPELIFALDAFGIPHGTSTPYLSHTASRKGPFKTSKRLAERHYSTPGFPLGGGLSPVGMQPFPSA